MNFEQWWEQIKDLFTGQVPNIPALKRLAKAAFEAGYAEALESARKQAALELELG